jgi:hypothetical protein
MNEMRANCTVSETPYPECASINSSLGDRSEMIFDDMELAALGVLADAGLIPRLPWSSAAFRRSVTEITVNRRAGYASLAKIHAIAR